MKINICINSVIPVDPNEPQVHKYLDSLSKLNSNSDTRITVNTVTGIDSVNHPTVHFDLDGLITQYSQLDVIDSLLTRLSARARYGYCADYYFNGYHSFKAFGPSLVTLKTAERERRAVLAAAMLNPQFASNPDRDELLVKALCAISSDSDMTLLNGVARGSLNTESYLVKGDKKNAHDLLERYRSHLLSGGEAVPCLPSSASYIALQQFEIDDILSILARFHESPDLSVELIHDITHRAPCLTMAASQ